MSSCFVHAFCRWLQAQKRQCFVPFIVLSGKIKLIRQTSNPSTSCLLGPSNPMSFYLFWACPHNLKRLSRNTGWMYMFPKPPQMYLQMPFSDMAVFSSHGSATKISSRNIKPTSWRRPAVLLPYIQTFLCLQSSWPKTQEAWKGNTAATCFFVAFPRNQSYLMQNTCSCTTHEQLTKCKHKTFSDLAITGISCFIKFLAVHVYFVHVYLSFSSVDLELCNSSCSRGVRHKRTWTSAEQLWHRVETQASFLGGLGY